MKLFKEITLIVSTSMFFFIIPDKVSADSYKLEPAVEIIDIQIIHWNNNAIRLNN